MIEVKCFTCNTMFNTDKLRGNGAVFRDGKLFCSQHCYSLYFVAEIQKTGGVNAQLQPKYPTKPKSSR